MLCVPMTRKLTMTQWVLTSVVNVSLLSFEFINVLLEIEKRKVSFGGTAACGGANRTRVSERDSKKTLRSEG